MNGNRDKIIQALMGIPLLLVLAACSSPERAPQRLLNNKFPVGSNEADLQNTLAERGYKPVQVECRQPQSLLVSGEVNSPCQYVMGMNTREQPPGTIPFCMFKYQPYFLASGAIVCWTTDDMRHISWRYADWTGPTPRLIPTENRGLIE